MLGRLGSSGASATTAARCTSRGRVRPRLWTSTSGGGGGGGYRFEQPLPSMLAAPSAARPAMPMPVPRPHPSTYYRSELAHKAVAPFLLGSLVVSTYFFAHADADLVAAAGPERGEHQQMIGLFSLFRYLSLTTDGPRLDLSELAALVDWRRLLALAPSRPAEGLVHYLYMKLQQGFDNTVALFPNVDIKPTLIRLGLLDTLEAALRPAPPTASTTNISEEQQHEADAASTSSSHDHDTIRLCAAYCVNRLSRNARAAQLLASKPGVVEGLLDLLDRELLAEDSTGRFLGFRHSESHTSAEVACTLLEALSNILEAGGGYRSALLLLLGSRAAATSTHPITGTRPAAAALADVSHDLVGKLAALLRHLELCDEHASNANRVFRDGHLAVYARFFPHALDDQVRRRMREVEAEVSRFLAALATGAAKARDPQAAAVLLRRDVLQGLAPLACSEARNASAFVPAARALHAVVDAYEQAAAEGLVQTPADAEALSDKSLLVDSHLNRRALAEAVAVAVAHPDDATLGAPFARLRSVGAMRLYTSSMACLIAGGCWGVLRTAMRFGPGQRVVHPVVAYSVNGVGAVMLNVLVGTYGLRNAVRARTYIEDDTTNVLWTWAMAGVDVAVVTTIVRKHPYSLLPMVMVNVLGHSTYPGTGLKSLDGLDIFALD